MAVSICVLMWVYNQDASVHEYVCWSLYGQCMCVTICVCLNECVWCGWLFSFWVVENTAGTHWATEAGWGC